jgi:protein TonB
MFSDSLLQNSGHARRGWTTVISFGIEAVAVALLVLVPLLGSVAMPAAKSMVINIPFGSPKAQPAVATHPHPATAPAATEASLRLRVPTEIHRGVEPEPPSAAPEAALARIGTGTPTGDSDIAAILNLPTTYTAAPPPPPRPAPEHVRIRVSQMESGALIHQVQPVYPAPARITRVQGTVQLAAVIGRDGAIKDLRVLSGHPMLVTAAVDAVRQWRYRPYILNGQPVEVETQISVNFSLGAQ